MSDFVSRAGIKLDHALNTFGLDVSGLTCADLGSNAGGFVDCLLQRGASKVYAIDTGYGALDWKLRKDTCVVVMERTNAMHVQLPEVMAFVSIDVAWTKQRHILPAARRLIEAGGDVVTLIKPHYEASASLLRGGVLQTDAIDTILQLVKTDIAEAGFEIRQMTQSPLKGAKGNVEFLAHLHPKKMP